MKLNIIVLALTLCACTQKQARQQKEDYKTMTVKTEDRTLTSEYAARLAGQQVVEVRPQVSGRITRICISEGQDVRRGQLLFVIDQVPYKAALDEAVANVKSAAARLATARLNMQSAKALREGNVVHDFEVATAANELDAAEAALAQAKAQEAAARNNLSYTEVKSPVDGVAGMINYRVGALVGGSIDQPLVTVADISRMHAYFSLAESQVQDYVEQYGSMERFVKQMAEVGLRMSNGRTYAEKGRISAVSGVVTKGTGTVTVRADFPNGRKLLIDGGSATVVLPSVKRGCIVIPQGATFELQEKVMVYKMVDGKPHSTPVGVFRINNGTEYVVETGLKAGDVIVAEGAGLVSEK